MLAKLLGKRILLLQGPIGPFFRRLGRELTQHGCSVHKINLNGGDDLFFWGPNVTRYRGRFDDWSTYLHAFLRAQRIEVVVLFGDSRSYHRVAVQVADALGCEVFVFEEGYLRPNFITLEVGGTNYRSSIRPLASASSRSYSEAWAPEAALGNTFWPSAIYAILYAWAYRLLGFRYVEYCHHKDLALRRQAGHWWRGLFRKIYYAVKERHVLSRLQQCRGYFVVALQVHDDFQVRNSQFGSVEVFIDHVMACFAKYAPSELLLVFKHHPMDRPHTDYTALMRERALQHGIGGRIQYVHDLPLPELLKQARGTVVINSTVGISSLYHHTPVFCASHSIYDCLAYEGSLDQFWGAPGVVDKRRVQRFRSWLRDCCQHNGSFYRRLAGTTNPTGVLWAEPLLAARPRPPVSCEPFVASDQSDGPESAQPLAL